MNREDIIRMAREVGATPYTNRHYPDRPTHTFNPEQLERFAAFVAAAERDRIARECAKLPFGDTAASFAAWIAQGGGQTL